MSGKIIYKKPETNTEATEEYRAFKGDTVVSFICFSKTIW